MSYDGDCGAGEYPDGPVGPRYGYRAAAAIKALREQKDAEIAYLKALLAEARSELPRPEGKHFRL